MLINHPIKPFDAFYILRFKVKVILKSEYFLQLPVFQKVVFTNYF